MVALHNGPEAEAGHSLASLLNDQGLGAVVGHVEPDALVLADLGNLDRVRSKKMPRGVDGRLNFNEINAVLILRERVTWGSTG